MQSKYAIIGLQNKRPKIFDFFCTSFRLFINVRFEHRFPLDYVSGVVIHTKAQLWRWSRDDDQQSRVDNLEKEVAARLDGSDAKLNVNNTMIYTGNYPPGALHS